MQEDMAPEGKDYVPPLPKDVKELLASANLAHLSIPDQPNPPHTCLMNFTFVAEEEVGWGSVMIIRAHAQARTRVRRHGRMRAHAVCTRTHSCMHTHMWSCIL